MAVAPSSGGGGGGGGLRAILENRKLRMAGPLPENMMFIKAAKVTEGLSQISEIQVDFLSPKRDLKLEDIVGRPITVKVQMGEDGASGSGGTGGGTGTTSGTWREFMGTCIEAQYVGFQEGYGFYSLQVRPWLWFLTRTTGCRIFQDKTAIEIIKQIFGDRGFADYTFKTSRVPGKRVYCVQYNETDYDFIQRLMEEEGIYYFSTVQGGKDHLILADGAGGHKPIEGDSTVKFHLREAGYRRKDDHIFEFRSSEAQRPGKVTLTDYNFENPQAGMFSLKAMPKGSHSHKDYERYMYPGRYRQAGLGDLYAKFKMEAEAWPFQVRYMVGNVREMATGATFTLANQTRAAENQEYLVTSAEHWMQTENSTEDESQQIKGLPGTIEFDEKNKDAHRTNFKVIPKTTPFRAPFKTPWPKIPGILIAKVTGPSGEEIHTDNFGRIKVQFPWDRDVPFRGDGKGKENSSCWVRVVTPWSGKDWGMIHVPRIGQEVVIQFEDGDIDRPICTGMLYNSETMPPYALAANKTQMGIKTRSSKGGTADNYNELVFEDKKDAEFIRMHSEKDFFLTVENDATISIGQTKKSPGDLKTDIHNSRTETIHEGDLTLTVAKGNETRDIKTNRNEKVGGNAEQEVTGNKKTVVKGNFNEEVTGALSTKVTGAHKTEVQSTQDVSVTGAIAIESTASITIKVGASSVKIDPSGVTIEGPMIKTNATGIAEHKASAMMVVQGGLVNIN